MRLVASALLVLSCAGCSREAPEEPVPANVTANVASPAPKPVETPPPPPENVVATPDANTTEAAAGANGVPAEVQAFIERREGCEHWAGEPDFDEARRKQIEDAVKALCPGIDTQLGALRKRFAKDPAVMAALADFEPLGMDD